MYASSHGASAYVRICVIIHGSSIVAQKNAFCAEEKYERSREVPQAELSTTMGTDLPSIIAVIQYANSNMHLNGVKLL